jgi:hypothetical protein
MAFIIGYYCDKAMLNEENKSELTCLHKFLGMS